MPVHDELGKRMKRYEAIPQISLMRRTPVAIRIDGKAFHTFTKHLKKPYDKLFHEAMENTMKYLCENIQNCIFGYTQSDEITLILTDYETLNTDAWFGYEVQKLCSISASMATMKFNQEFQRLAEDYIWEWSHDMVPQSVILWEKEKTYHTHLRDCITRGAMFDARCFNIPKEEAVNLVLWRQFDAERNSINSMGQSYFSHKELQNKNCSEVLKMLEDKGVFWKNHSNAFKHGVACINNGDGWELDYNMPILKGEDRDYLERLI